MLLYFILTFAVHKNDINQASTVFALTTGISVKHSNNKN